MPKIIPELREALITAARKRILESEEHDLTMRQIAEDCGVAAGTVYNYFASKEELMAALMLEDWLTVCAALNAAARDHAGPVEGLRTMEGALRAFVDKYRPAWDSYGRRAPIGEHHAQLIGQIEDAVSLLLRRCGKAPSPAEVTVLAEMLLAVSQREAGAFDRLLPVIEKLIV